MLHFTITTESVFSTSITSTEESQQEEINNSSLSTVAYMLVGIAKMQDFHEKKKKTQIALTDQVGMYENCACLILDQ